MRNRATGYTDYYNKTAKVPPGNSAGLGKKYPSEDDSDEDENMIAARKTALKKRLKKMKGS